MLCFLSLPDCVPSILEQNTLIIERKDLVDTQDAGEMAVSEKP